jgi:hypothetical protein
MTWGSSAWHVVLTSYCDGDPAFCVLIVVLGLTSTWYFLFSFPYEYHIVHQTLTGKPQKIHHHCRDVKDVYAHRGTMIEQCLAAG